MNITLSADRNLVKKARESAAMKGTTLNQMIREFMEQIAGEDGAEAAAAEFARLAEQKAGRSPRGFQFDRQAAHER